MKKISLFIKVVIVTMMSVAFISPVMVAASNKDAVCQGVGAVSGGSGCSTPSGSSSINDVIKKGLNLFSAVIGIIAVVMIMVGGIKYITSQGDAAQVNSAKNTILYAAIGLVVVALAQIIVQFVLSRFK